MTARLTSQTLIGALVRRVQAAGGTAMILHKGESIAGTILVQLLDRGANLGLVERVTGLSGRTELVPSGPRNDGQDTDISSYIERRIRIDPDIWIVELDVAEGQQLAADILCSA